MPPKQKRGSKTQANIANNDAMGSSASPNKRTKTSSIQPSDNANGHQISNIELSKFTEFIELITTRKEDPSMIKPEEVTVGKNAIKGLAQFVKAGDPERANINGREILQCVKEAFDLIGNESAVGDEDDHITDEICVVGGRAILRDSEIKCPYSLKVMLHPLKNNHPTSSCIHRVEKEVFEILSKSKGVVKCAFSGCSGLWDPRYVIEDKAHGKRIQDHLSKQKSKMNSVTIIKPSENNEVIDLTK